MSLPNDRSTDSADGKSVTEVLRSLFAIERLVGSSERNSDGQHMSIARILAANLERSLDEVLMNLRLLSPEIFTDDCRTLDLFLCEQMGINPEMSTAYPLERALRLVVLTASRKMYRENPELQDRLRKAAKYEEEKALDEVQEVVESARRKFALKVLQRSDALAGGLSGSLVLRVYYGEQGEQAKLGVFKITDDQDKFDREQNGHLMALASWMSHWVEPIMLAQRLDLEKRRGSVFVMLSPLAFPPIAGKQLIPSLHDLTANRERMRCIVAATEIGNCYSLQYESLQPQGEDYITRREIFLSILHHWDSPLKDNVWAKDAFWLLEGLPAPSCSCIQDGNKVLWNPLWLITHGCFGGDAKIEGRFTDQHGDLNARNVMLPLKANLPGSNEPQLRLIDFEKWATHQSAVLDPCWLSLYVLKATAPSAVSCDFWDDLPSRFYSAIFDPKFLQQGDSGPFQLALEIVAQLFQPFHEMADRNGHTVKNDFFTMTSLTLAAAGLAFAYYERRRLNRKSVSRRAEINEKYCRLWALFGIRLSAMCLSPIETAEMQMPQASVDKIIKNIFVD